MSQPVRISFGIIVLNGEPFIRYALRALYPFAHEIIVVEGAVLSAIENATADGHSLDSTLSSLQAFKQHEDPEDKLIIITRDGFWEEKDAMSQAYAERATGNYLWQVDSDEFYQPEDMQTIITMLEQNPSITAVSFRMLTFWAAPNYLTDGWYLRRGENAYHRLFQWGEGYTYNKHRPPTVLNAAGTDLRKLNWLKAEALEKEKIYLYHYSLLFPQQVQDKSRYYERKFPTSGSSNWAQQNFMELKNPYRVHNVYDFPSWLEHFKGTPPPQIQQMWQDIQSGTLAVETRPTEDIEALLASPAYQLGRILYKWADYLQRPFSNLPQRWAYWRSRIQGKLRKILSHTNT